MSEQVICDECGDDGGVIQQVSIGWPGTVPFYLVEELSNGTRLYEPNPNANGRHVTLWLHRECEAAAMARIETEQR
jgi:hypothetical protein